MHFKCIGYNAVHLINNLEKYLEISWIFNSSYWSQNIFTRLGCEFSWLRGVRNFHRNTYMLQRYLSTAAPQTKLIRSRLRVPLTRLRFSIHFREESVAINPNFLISVSTIISQVFKFSWYMFVLNIFVLTDKTKYFWCWSV